MPARVSVPCRGLWFVNSSEGGNREKNMFPSPVGVYGLLIRTEQNGSKRQLKFPSPVGVYGLLIRKMLMHSTTFCECFRPLSGFMVC